MADLTYEIVKAARWELVRGPVRLTTRKRDGAQDIATVDTSNQWRYVATLCNGERIIGWPLNPVMRAARKRLYEVATKRQRWLTTQARLRAAARERGLAHQEGAE